MLITSCTNETNHRRHYKIWSKAPAGNIWWGFKHTAVSVFLVENSLDLWNVNVLSQSKKIVCSSIEWCLVFCRYTRPELGPAVRPGSRHGVAWGDTGWTGRTMGRTRPGSDQKAQAPSGSSTSSTLIAGGCCRLPALTAPPAPKVPAGPSAGCQLSCPVWINPLT